MLKNLLGGEQHEPFPAHVLTDDEDYLELLSTEVMKWAIPNGLADNLRFKGRVKAAD